MKRFLVAALALAFIVSGVTFAQGRGMGPCGQGMGSGMGQGPMMMKGDFDPPDMPHCMRGIDLTEDQEKKIAGLKRDHHRKMLEMKSDMAGTRAKMKLLITEDKYDKGAVEKLIDKVADHHKTVMKMRVEHFREVREILTPEQRVQFDGNLMHGGFMGHDKGKFKRPGMGRMHRGG